MPLFAQFILLYTLIFHPSMENKYTFLALGDSYTIGEAVAENERWPEQFCALMQQQNKPFGTPEIIAKTGWTTDELLAAIAEKNPKGPFDLVSLLIGVNNQYRGYPEDQYIKEFGRLLNMAIGFAGNRKDHVVVVSIPDWGVTPFAEGRDRAQIAREIDHYNALNRRITEEAGVLYVEITAHSRLAQTDASLIASDHLHPSGLMYAYWAKQVAEKLANRY